MSTAFVTASSSFVPPQIEGANFLNLMIIDDERAIREIWQPLGCPVDSKKALDAIVLWS